MSVIKNLSDRMLALFVPRVEAHADEFTQWCGCYCGLRCYNHYRTCWTYDNYQTWTCGPCTQSGNIEC
ncbi:hypothetical protein ACIBCR_05325 [Micromonospora echinospora]|uniref:hypothetical protein n=1 Tax=Micromonospora echinospora TaxID=1877 RepID=UPI0037A6B602